MIHNSKDIRVSSSTLNPKAVAFVPSGLRLPDKSQPSAEQKASEAYEKKKSFEKELSDLQQDDAEDYEQLMRLVDADVLSLREETGKPDILIFPQSSPPQTIYEKLQKVFDYSSLMQILINDSDLMEKKDIKKSVEILMGLYWKGRILPPKDLVEKIGNLILSRVHLFAPYELRNFVEVLQRIEERDSRVSTHVLKHLQTERYYLAHQYPRSHSEWEVHSIDDSHIESLVKYNGLYCDKCSERFPENPGMSLVKGCINSVKRVISLEKLKELELTVQPMNFSEIQRCTKELEHCIQTNNWQNIQNVIHQLEQNGGKVSSKMLELARRTPCSYKILMSLIDHTRTVTIEDFRIAFAREYPLGMLSFMLSYWQGQGPGQEPLEKIMALAVEMGCSEGVLQLLLDAGGKITLPSIKAALRHSSPYILEFVLSHYRGGKLSPMGDLRYIEMHTLPKSKWEFVFSRLEDPFEEQAMHEILTIFLSLNVLRQITPLEFEAAQFFLEKGGYIPNMTIKRILMSGLPQERKLEFLRRWIREGGVVTADLIDFAVTPKTDRRECFNTEELVEYLFSQWTVDQEEISGLLKTLACWTDFGDFIKILIDKSENLQFVDEFLRHKKSVEIIECFLSKNGSIPSSSIPLILRSELPISLKQKLVHHWKEQGGEVSSEILDSAFFSVSYRNLHEIVDYLLPFWKVEPEKLSSLIKSACFGGASLSVIKSLIDMYEHPPFIVELLYQDQIALEVFQYFHSKGMEINLQAIALILKYPGYLYTRVGQKSPVKENPDLFKGKDAKLWLIRQWAQGQKIVSSELIKLAKDYKNAPEVLELLESLKAEEEPEISEEVIKEFSEIKLEKPVPERFYRSKQISLDRPHNPPISEADMNLTSCLKKPSKDEAGSAGAFSKHRRKVEFTI